MATVHITIPEPLLALSPPEHFAVVIKDSSGSVVYTGSQTNAEFDITLSAGSYEMFVTYKDYTNGWCFDVTDCDCPVFSSADISESAPGVRYLELFFDMSGGFPSCGFVVYAKPVPSSSFAAYPITSLLDFTSHVGSIYKLQIFIGSAASVDFNIAKFGSFGGTVCYSSTVAYSCSTPALLVDPHHPFAITITYVLIASVWYMKFSFWNCGTSCHTFQVWYKENYVVTGYVPDENVKTITVNCGDPAPYYVLMEINPVPTFFFGQAAVAPVDLTWLAYFIKMTDCCGNVLPAPTVVNFDPIHGYVY